MACSNDVQLEKPDCRPKQCMFENARIPANIRNSSIFIIHGLKKKFIFSYHQPSYISSKIIFKLFGSVIFLKCIAFYTTI